MIVKVLRKMPWNKEQYWEEFIYDGSEDITVAGLLDNLNYKDDVTNSAGEIVPRISWECSCLQGMCGGCAMVIDGRPGLACESFVSEHNNDPKLRDYPLTIAPLSKFPVIADLVVDRGIIHENLLKVNSYIKEYKASPPSEFLHQYQVTKCLKCGLCLEVCPNYVEGKNFFGALFADDCYLIATRSGVFDKAIKKDYAEHFAKGCSKSLACVDICPAGIPTLSSMAKMNK